MIPDHAYFVMRDSYYSPSWKEGHPSVFACIVEDDADSVVFRMRTTGVSLLKDILTRAEDYK